MIKKQIAPIANETAYQAYMRHDEEILRAYFRHVADKQMDCDIKALFKKVIFNDPATIVFWNDGTKTVVKRYPGEPWDPEKGLAMAIVKKAFGNSDSYYKTFKDIMNGAAAIRNVKPKEVKPIAQKSYREAILERYPWRETIYPEYGGVINCPGAYIDGADRITLGRCPHNRDCAGCFSATCSSSDEARIHDLRQAPPISMSKAVLSKLPRVKMEAVDHPRGCPFNYIDGVHVPLHECAHMSCTECWSKPFPCDKDGRNIHPYKYL